jgi:hypothetical protein
MVYVSETEEMLKMLPTENPGDIYHDCKALNAYVCKDQFGRVGIFLKDGGWLGAPVGSFEGDVAPFAG